PYTWAIGGRDTVDFMAKRHDSQQRGYLESGELRLELGTSLSQGSVSWLVAHAKYSRLVCYSLRIRCIFLG
ncbi:hypothetical protein N657DRAFT_651569, partial [Parathielavia appendiculata]